MTELSALVPLVPVLAKADSMTTNELEYFRKGVREALEQVSSSPSEIISAHLRQGRA
jgi:septin family protein